MQHLNKNMSNNLEIKLKKKKKKRIDDVSTY